MYAVYLITNTVNGKRYVGKAADPDQRWRAHVNRGTVLHSAICKYGVTAFRREVLSWHESEEDAFGAERDAIANLGTKVPDGYNLTDGGEGASGIIKSDETILKIKLASAGRRAGPGDCVGWRTKSKTCGNNLSAPVVPVWHQDARAVRNGPRTVEVRCSFHRDPFVRDLRDARCRRDHRVASAERLATAILRLKKAWPLPQPPPATTDNRDISFG